jgi:hypothetical protein
MLKSLILPIMLLAHPVHVSLMSVEYSEKQDVLNVFLKVYSDDFLLDYKLLTGDTSKIDLVANKVLEQKVIGKYLDEKVQIFAEGKKLVAKISKFDPSDGELKIDMIFNTDRKSKTYNIRNLIMTDLYQDQSNLLIFKYGTYEEGIKLTPEENEHSFKVK